MKEYNLIIIGGGLSGMTAALSAMEENTSNVLIIERESNLGGLLNRFICNGFGKKLLNVDLTGPEYINFIDLPSVDTELVNSLLEEEQPECFHPESGELMLGDIIISLDKVKEQAENYGHSYTREYAFLIAHSMLHLMGYDHIEDDDYEIMNKKEIELSEKIKI